MTPGTNAHFTIDDQIKEARRELNMRKRVFWRWVEQKKMSTEDMNEKIGLQEAIIDTLEAVKALHWPDKQAGLEI